MASSRTTAEDMRNFFKRALTSRAGTSSAADPGSMGVSQALTGVKDGLKAKPTKQVGGGLFGPKTVAAAPATAAASDKKPLKSSSTRRHEAADYYFVVGVEALSYSVAREAYEAFREEERKLSSEGALDKFSGANHPTGQQPPRTSHIILFCDEAA